MSGADSNCLSAQYLDKAGARQGEKRRIFVKMEISGKKFFILRETEEVLVNLDKIRQFLRILLSLS